MARLSLSAANQNLQARRRASEVFRRLITLALMSSLFAIGAGLLPRTILAGDDDKRNATAEQVAETVVAIYGGREGLKQIRRNGIERGRVTRVNSEGRPEESTYERRFMRGESSEKDKVRLDQKLPTQEFSLVYGSGNTFGISNGSSFTPREDLIGDFTGQMWHGIDALLRYKENGSTVNLIGKDKQKNLDLYVLDLTDTQKRRTRYYISSKTGRILWLEYEETPAGASAPVKYQRKFHDYRYAQGTLVPYNTVLYEDGKQTQETRLLTVTYGVKMEEALFQNPETQASPSSSARP
jgi:hypothetical protein